MTEHAPKRLHRDVHGKKIGGVCAGLGRYLGIDPTIVRVVTAVSAFFGGAGLVAYLVAWVLLDPAPDGLWDDEPDERTIRLDRDERKILGVCSGIAKAYDLDPTIVRVAFILLLLLGGAGGAIYLALALVLRNQPPPASTPVDEPTGTDDPEPDEPEPDEPTP
ncbi:MAG: PspC domain-containing protein [Actinomycetota bacterium]